MAEIDIWKSRFQTIHEDSVEKHDSKTEISTETSSTTETVEDILFKVLEKRRKSAETGALRKAQV